LLDFFGLLLLFLQLLLVLSDLEESFHESDSCVSLPTEVGAIYHTEASLPEAAIKHAELLRIQSIGLLLIFVKGVERFWLGGEGSDGV